MAAEFRFGNLFDECDQARVIQVATAGRLYLEAKRMTYQHTENRTGNHEFDCVNAPRQQCDGRRNENGDRKRIRKSMRRHLHKGDRDHADQRWSDSLQRRFRPYQCPHAVQHGQHRQHHHERR